MCSLRLLQNFEWTHPCGRSTRCLYVDRSEPPPSTWTRCLQTSSQSYWSTWKIITTLLHQDLWTLLGRDGSPCDSRQTQTARRILQDNEVNGAWLVPVHSSVPRQTFKGEIRGNISISDVSLQVYPVGLLLTIRASVGYYNGGLIFALFFKSQRLYQNKILVRLHCSLLLFSLYFS